MSNTIRFMTFEKYHGKTGIGSTRIRVHNLIKYWDEADLYKFGENPDVMIWQKVYTTFDYKFQEHFKGIQILDICDPDFRDGPDIFIKETLDNMDAVVVPTKNFQELLQPMTDTPVRLIKDRFDLSEFPTPKKHSGKAKTCVWFGYAHNATSLKFAVQSLERRGLDLLVVADEDPTAYRWADKPDEYMNKYKWVKYQHPEAYNEIQKADICVLPDNIRPWDRLKSENKTVIAQLLGLPVAKDAEQLEQLLEADQRAAAIDAVYGKLKEEYDCHKSIDKYRELIEYIKEQRDVKSKPSS